MSYLYAKKNIISVAGIFYAVICMVCFKAEAKQTNAIISNIPNHNPYFIGREGTLKKLKQEIYDVKNNTIAITGLAGIGKTQVAKKFADLNEQNYDIIWWIDANKDIASQFVKLGEELDRNYNKHIINPFNRDIKAIAYQVKAELQSNTVRWLLIFDNAPNLESILDFIPIIKKESTKHIIITSKNKGSWEDVIELSKFNRKESKWLLEKSIPKFNYNNLEELAGILGDYPLAIAEAGAVIRENPRMSIKEYIELYRHNTKNLWDYEEKIFAEVSSSDKVSILDNYKQTVSSVIKVSINDIKAKSNRTFHVLCLCAFLDNESIPEVVLRNYLHNDILAFNEGIRTLLKYSFINTKLSYSNRDNFYQIHEIQQEVIKSMLTESQTKQYIEEAIRALNKAIPELPDLYIPIIIKNEQYLYNIEKISAQADKYKIINNDLISLQIKYLGYYLGGKRDFKRAKIILNKLENLIEYYPKISKKNLIKFHISKSSYLSWHHEDNMAGIIEVNKAYKLLEDLPDAGQDTLTVYNRLVQNYYFLGEIEKALRYSNLSKDLVENFTGFLANKDAYYGARARLLMEIGEVDNALEAINSSINEMHNYSTVEGIIGNFTVYSLQASILLLVGEYQNSYEKSLKIYNKIKEVLQETPHHFTALALNTLAGAALKLNKIDFAEEKINESITILLGLYGEEEKSRHNAAAHAVLGDIYVAQGKYNNAHIEYGKAENIFDKILKIKKVYCMGDLYAKLAINGARIKDSFITLKYLNKLKENFGSDHKHTFEVINYLHDHGLETP